MLISQNTPIERIEPSVSNPMPCSSVISPPLHLTYTVSTIQVLVLAVHTIVRLVGLSISFFQLLIAQLEFLCSIGLNVVCVYEPLETL